MSSAKRRDNKNRILNRGESQRQDGRYTYKYVDAQGENSLRHTFCTQLAQKNMNPKNLQYIMGHASITITLDLYAHSSEAGANREMRSLIA